MIYLLVPPDNVKVAIEPNAVIIMLEVEMSFLGKENHPGVEIHFFTSNQLLLPDGDRTVVDFINKHRRDGSDNEYKDSDEFVLQLR